MTAGRPCCDSPVKGAARQRCRTCHRRGLQTRAVCTAGFGQGARSWWPGVSAALRWSGRSVRPSSGCVLDRNLEAHQVGGATTGSPRAWNPSLIPSAVSTLYRQCLAHRDGQRAGGAIVLPEPRTPGSLAAYGGPLQVICLLEAGTATAGRRRASVEPPDAAGGAPPSGPGKRVEESGVPGLGLEGEQDDVRGSRVGDWLGSGHR